MTVSILPRTAADSLAPPLFPQTKIRRSSAAVLSMLVLATGLWIVSLHRVDAESVGHWGLLAAEPLTWYLGLALGLLATVITCLRARHGGLWLLAPALLLLVLIIHGTPAIEYAFPRYAWTFKGIGVVDVLRQHRSPRLLDIYFDWPGFFSAVLWLADSTGLSLFTMAKWTPAFNEAVATAGVWYLATGVFSDRRTASLATLLYLIGNWIGQDYFSPQGYAYDLFIPAVGAAVRLAAPTAPRPPARRALIAIIGLTWLAILISHQLTPVELWLDLAAIAAVSARRGAYLRRPRIWIPLLALGATEIIWVALALPYLHRAGYALFTNFDVQGSSSLGAISSVKSSAVVARTLAVDALYFGFFAVGGLYGLRHARRSWSCRVLLACVVVPVLTRLVQNYGGEGNLRAYLFALPFLACLIAQLLLSGRFPPVRGRSATTRDKPTLGRVRVGVLSGIVVLVCAAFLLAYYGQEEVSVIGASDVDTMNWFYSHAAPGTTPMYLVDGVPSKGSARYLDFPDIGTDVSLLAQDPRFTDRFAHGFDPALAARFLSSLRPVDLVLTPSQARDLDYAGVLTRRAYRSFIEGLQLQPNLHLIYAADGGYIWQVGPAPSTSLEVESQMTRALEATSLQTLVPRFPRNQPPSEGRRETSLQLLDLRACRRLLRTTRFTARHCGDSAGTSS